MSKHIAILAVTSAIGLLATSPATAQVDDRYAGVVEARTPYEPGWEAEAAAGAVYSVAEMPVVQEYNSEPMIAGSDSYNIDYYDEYEYFDHEPRRRIYRTIPHREEAPRFAYSAEQRSEWLSQCRALHADNTRLAYY